MSRRDCPACGRYCWNRCRHCGYVRPITRPPDHKRKLVMAVRFRPTGTPEFKTMSSRKAAKVLGGQRGGLRSAANGRAHRWTTESARKAAIKSWTKRRKFNKRIQARVGVAAHRRTALAPRAFWRAYYAENPTRGIQSCPETQQWFRIHADGTSREISERTALQALGHLKSPRGYIPDSITPVPRTGRSRMKKDR